jgi:pyruvate/2-oxoglutarate dehydrogenase complex dihydrolipoamide dehydrogenase (E3) component
VRAAVGTHVAVWRERGGVQEEAAGPEVAVIGAGAVGTVAASPAEQAGADVVICARSPVGPVVLELDGEVGGSRHR